MFQYIMVIKLLLVREFEVCKLSEYCFNNHAKFYIYNDCSFIFNLLQLLLTRCLSHWM